jgi:hypothetical protein
VIAVLAAKASGAKQAEVLGSLRRLQLRRVWCGQS